jgi:hypothetical protein
MKRAFGCIALVLGACSEPAERPETISVCDGEGCEGAGTTARGSSDGSSTSTTGTSTGGEGITLSGDVLVFVDDLFAALLEWEPNAVVLAPGSAEVVVEGEFDGSLYRVVDVAPRQAAWVWVAPADEFLLSPMPTLQPLNTVVGDNYDLYMVYREVLEEMYSGLRTPVVIDDDGAQVVVRLIDSIGDPVPGASIQTAEGDFVAYYDGTSWNEDRTSTDQTGLVMIGNVVAPPYPGRGIQIVVAGAEDDNHTVDVVESTLTLASLELE